MKKKYRLMIVIVIIIAGALLFDWEQFKAGLLGEPPVVEIESPN